MLEHPLHESGWLAQLRGNPNLSYRLAGHFLTDTGSSLTAYWLDVLCCYGPVTAIPGLFTLYDVDIFGRRYRKLIDAYLTIQYLDVSTQQDLSIEGRACPGFIGKSTSRRQQRRRRTRLAVFLAICYLHRYQPMRLAAARQYEQLRIRPSTPFLP